MSKPKKPTENPSKSTDKFIDLIEDDLELDARKIFELDVFSQ